MKFKVPITQARSDELFDKVSKTLEKAATLEHEAGSHEHYFLYGLVAVMAADIAETEFEKYVAGAITMFIFLEKGRGENATDSRKALEHIKDLVEMLEKLKK